MTWVRGSLLAAMKSMLVFLQLTMKQLQEDPAAVNGSMVGKAVPGGTYLQFSYSQEERTCYKNAYSANGIRILCRCRAHHPRHFPTPAASTSAAGGESISTPIPMIETVLARQRHQSGLWRRRQNGTHVLHVQRAGPKLVRTGSSAAAKRKYRIPPQADPVGDCPACSEFLRQTYRLHVHRCRGFDLKVLQSNDWLVFARLACWGVGVLRSCPSRAPFSSWKSRTMQNLQHSFYLDRTRTS